MFACAVSVLAAETKTEEFAWPGYQADGQVVKGWFSENGNGKKPKVVGEFIRLMNAMHTVDSECAVNVATWEQSHNGLYDVVEGQFDFSMQKGAHGMGFALLNTDKYGRDGAGPADVAKWEEPNLNGTFAIGLDSYNPANGSWFDSNGNFYGRPQHELSIHWDGREFYKKVTPVDFRDDQKHTVSWKLHYVVGGAEITIDIDGQNVFDRFFIAHMKPYEFRPCFGSRHGEVKNNIHLLGLQIKTSEKSQPETKPVIDTIFDGELMYAKNRKPQKEHVLIKPEFKVGRSVLTVDLKGAPGGCDPWDKKGAVYFWTEDGERFELARFITPYGKEYSWDFDVTDFQSILKGKMKFGLEIGTYMPKTEDPAKQKGWKVTVKLTHYQGEKNLRPLEIRNLWNGTPDLGNPKKPLEKFFSPKSVDIPKGVTAVKLRLTVTGHGMAYKNAGEFYALSRTVRVKDKEFKNLLWKDDCYLNPCRPQGGSWKFDRAGWAPGDKVEPWEIDITDLVEAGKPIKIEYIPEPYENKLPDKWCQHWVETQIVYYGKGE